MRAERPYVIAGTALVGLVGASVVVVAPIAPSAPDLHIASPELRLTVASTSLAYVPVNLIQAIANVPTNELAAMQSMTNALLFTGSWWTGRGQQIWGTDPADPPKWKAGVAMLVPFPALSEPVGESVAVWAEANFPVDAKCHYICSDPGPIILGLGQVPVWQLYSGYTFPTVVDPLGPVEGAYGFPGTGPGNTMPWSGQTVKLDPLAPVTSVINYLVSPPTGVKHASFADVVTTTGNLGGALVLAFSPFTPGGPLTPGWPYSEEACPACYAVDGKSSAPATAISAQTLTQKVTAILSGNNVQGTVVKNTVENVKGKLGNVKDWVTNSTRGKATASLSGGQDGKADVLTASKALFATTHVSIGSPTVAPKAGIRLRTLTTSVGKVDSTTATSADPTSDGKTEKPGKSVDTRRQLPARPAAAVKSVSDRIRSSVSKVTDGLKGVRPEKKRPARTDAGK
jgi:hypothetical protein